MIRHRLRRLKAGAARHRPGRTRSVAVEILISSTPSFKRFAMECSVRMVACNAEEPSHTRNESDLLWAPLACILIFVKSVRGAWI